MVKVSGANKLIGYIPVGGKTEAMLKYVAEMSYMSHVKVSAENARAYSPIKYRHPLVKMECSYSIEKGSKELAPYKGPLVKNAGKSTPWNVLDEGGGWLKGSLDTPLNTRGAHDCAILNLINESKNEHLLFHVYPESKKEDIVTFIKKYSPRFNKINILGGDIPTTQGTVDSIIDAVKQLNPKIKPQFYHSTVIRPEVVAYQGKLYNIEESEFGQAPFKEYRSWYISEKNHS